ncbi:hypothetical protein ABFG95_02320 [Achromobacter sp. HNDS-1]|jgi:hypothetical protein|uniref:Uncharacterized protein n=1 Tax=Achromobacter sp. HNDS-1 TaxID=3151598 RepID=A0AAU7LBR5_9BURK|nr:hypothetical protein [Achromobacter ruhlandii]MCI1837962.1 hypothetical protein [Achromobacter ruhlandii]
MYFPSDPNKTPALWEALRDGLLTSNVSYVLENGKDQSAGLSRKATSAEADFLINRMRRLGYVRVGVSQLTATPPHFGVLLSSDGKVANLMEYLTLDSAKDRPDRDISLLVDLMFYELPNLRKLIVPLRLEVIEIPGVGVDIDSQHGVAEFSRAPIPQVK